MSKTGKTVTAVRSTHGLEVPVTDNTGLDLVTQEYIRFIINKANNKMEENFKRIHKFQTLLQSVLSEPEQSKSTNGTNNKPKEIYRRKKKRIKSEIKTGNNDVGSVDASDEADELGLDMFVE